MQIQWLGLRGLHPDVRATVEARLQRLAQGHDDLSLVRIGSATVQRDGVQRRVRIEGELRGHPFVLVREGEALGVLLSDALEAVERQVHEQRRALREKREPLTPYPFARR